MRQEDDVAAAREQFYCRPVRNLTHLLRYRFSWMNDHLPSGDPRGVEVGAGIGVSRDYIRARRFFLTDLAGSPWLDIQWADSMAMPIRTASLDFVICSNMVHHLASPVRFLEEISRVLKEGGVLLIQDVNCSFFLRLVLRLMRKEGYSFDQDVFDRSLLLSDPDDPWSANNAVPNLLFDDVDRFHREVPYFRITRNTFSEFILFLNSGGVTAKTAYLPLPAWCLRFAERVDVALASAFPMVFALQRQIVLTKDSTMTAQQSTGGRRDGHSGRNADA
jgi:SAM-dependent methyltransferase